MKPLIKNAKIYDGTGAAPFMGDVLLEAEMLAILEKALQQGAAGLSLGMIYEPGLYADVEEQRKVAELCVKYNKPLTVHPRAESKVSMAYPQLFGRSHLLRAFDEQALKTSGKAIRVL